MEKDDEPPQPCSLEDILNLENNSPAFGVTYEALDLIPEEGVTLIYRGFHNIQMSLEIYKGLDSDELLAVAYISGRDKRFNSHHAEINMQVSPKGFPEFVERAYNNFRKSRNGAYPELVDNLIIQFKDSDEARKLRYSQISPIEQENFMKSYSSDYICSNKENPYAPNAYSEPETKKQKIEKILENLKNLSNLAKNH